VNIARERERQRQRDRERERERQGERQRETERERGTERDRERDREERDRDERSCAESFVKIGWSDYLILWSESHLTVQLTRLSTLVSRKRLSSLPLVLFRNAEERGQRQGEPLGCWGRWSLWFVHLREERSHHRSERVVLVTGS
jgi:hypothetical protein